VIQYLYLGRVPYFEALRLQEELVALRTTGRIGNVLLLLEHPPVLTLGRNAKRSNVLASDELLAARGLTLHEINRGGDVTYHGPGQLIGYPIFDLRSLRNPNGGNRLGPVDFVRLMEEALIRLCGEFGVPAGRICGLTGVWCGLPLPQDSSERPLRGTQDSSKGPQSAGPGRKIAAIGIHVARGVTSHGFAFNVTTDLRDFALINPCGITDRPVTSLEREIANEIGREVAGPHSLPSLESIAHQAARQFGHVFSEPIQTLESLAALRAQAQASAESAPEPPAPAAPDPDSSTPEFPAPEFPANDTPLQIPPEIEHLRRTKDRPIPA
jgi:lipoyl(octanoyl) transferase